MTRKFTVIVLLLFFTYPVYAEEQQANFIVMSHQKLPSNDGCIALGQAIVANAIIDNLKSQT